MIRPLVSCSLAIVALACSNSVGPTTSARWASPGYELRLTPMFGSFVVACSRTEAIPPTVRFDETGTIRFSGKLTNSSGSRPFAFVGQLLGDTLMASMSVTQSSSGVVTYVWPMIRDGDPEWALLNCAP
jgi:hypothetical protein